MAKGSEARVVVTGFRAFPGVPDNPSQRVIEYLQAHPEMLPEGAETRLFDVSYDSIEGDIDAVFADPPATLVLTGYSRRADGIVLETLATDACDPGRPDAAGFAPSGQAEEAGFCENEAVDFGRLSAALAERGLPCVLSRDAGAYLCNRSYRLAMQRIAERGCATRAIFVHIPAIAGTPLADESARPMALEEIAEGVTVVARELEEGVSPA